MSIGIEIGDEAYSAMEKLHKQGKAFILVAVDGICIGVISLSDVIRPTAKEMVKKLSDMRTKTVLLTGDNSKTADFFAKQVGITEVCAELLPEEKVSNITLLQKDMYLLCCGYNVGAGIAQSGYRSAGT